MALACVRTVWCGRRGRRRGREREARQPSASVTRSGTLSGVARKFDHVSENGSVPTQNSLPSGSAITTQWEPSSSMGAAGQHHDDPYRCLLVLGRAVGWLTATGDKPVMSLPRFGRHLNGWRVAARQEGVGVPNDRKPYPPEFRAEAVRLSLQRGKRWKEVAAELGSAPRRSGCGASRPRWTPARPRGLPAANRRSCAGCASRCGCWPKSATSPRRPWLSSCGRPIGDEQVPGAGRAGEGPPRCLPVVPRAGRAARELLRLEGRPAQPAGAAGCLADRQGPGDPHGRPWHLRRPAHPRRAAPWPRASGWAASGSPA